MGIDAYHDAAGRYRIFLVWHLRRPLTCYIW
jgi:hypothetical protein